MEYVINDGPGRDAFVRYWRLIAEEIKDHPSAFALELMNEPISINRRDMYDTWRAAAEAVGLEGAEEAKSLPVSLPALLFPLSLDHHLTSPYYIPPRPLQ